jgi:hypothetical protein
MKGHSRDFKGVVMLQICMGLIKVEPASGFEACVTTLEGGSEEFRMEVDQANIKDYETKIKVEELVDIKEENPEPIKFPPIKTEPEVSVWGACV